jgi:hypothetical protein
MSKQINNESYACFHTNKTTHQMFKNSLEVASYSEKQNYLQNLNSLFQAWTKLFHL